MSGQPSWHSLLAGLVTGGIEGVATYPTEYVKTQSQLARQQVQRDNAAPVQRVPAVRHHSTLVAASARPVHSPWSVVTTMYNQRGIKGFYTGCTPMAIGNSLKAGVRFFTFDSIKHALHPDRSTPLPLSKSILAGLLAGLAEGALAMTPFEAIKTRMIQEHSSHFVRSTRQIVRQDGFAALYRGLSATMLRQGANSAVRLSSYSTIRSSYEQMTNAKMGALGTFGAGASAGVITVYCTMPFDVIKTRSQARQASSMGKSGQSLVSTGLNIVRREGVLRLWAGTGPRLTRLIFSGGIAFTVYEATMDALSTWK